MRPSWSWFPNYKKGKRVRREEYGWLRITKWMLNHCQQNHVLRRQRIWLS